MAKRLVEQLLELAADAVAVVAGVDEHVCRERWKPLEICQTGVPSCRAHGHR
jgi:hypothetical protein